MDYYFFDTSTIVKYLNANKKFFGEIIDTFSKETIIISSIVIEEITNSLGHTKNGENLKHLKQFEEVSTQYSKFKKDYAKFKKLSNEYKYDNQVTLERLLLKLKRELAIAHEDLEKSREAIAEDLEERIKQLKSIEYTVLNIDYDKRIELWNEISYRVETEMEPGQKDLGKKGENKYNDIFIWLQLIEYFKNKKDSNIFFITDDFKELNDSVQSVLIAEFKRRTNSSNKLNFTRGTKVLNYDMVIDEFNIWRQTLSYNQDLYYDDDSILYNNISYNGIMDVEKGLIDNSITIETNPVTFDSKKSGSLNYAFNYLYDYSYTTDRYHGSGYGEIIVSQKHIVKFEIINDECIFSDEKCLYDDVIVLPHVDNSFNETMNYSARKNILHTYNFNVDDTIEDYVYKNMEEYMNY